MNIYPEANFRDILDILNYLSFPDYINEQDNIRYAVLELLSNSLRAHREKNVKKNIIITFNINDNNLEVSIKDFGGGFDPGNLPYNLEDDPNNIDNTGLKFLEYQKKHNYLRFGMGLLLAKRTFPIFEIIFFNKNEEPVAWSSGPILGTLIKAATGADLYAE